MSKYKTYLIVIFSTCIGVLFFYNEYRKSILVPEEILTITPSTNKVPISEESCIDCHHMTGVFSPFHDPQIIGCVNCHLGNASETTKEGAHHQMIKIPGNLSDAPVTCGKCHAKELHNIQHSLMTTNSGIIAIDKYIFGEASDPNQQYHIKDLQDSPADKHLKQLCANCHLGAEKKTYGAISNLSRGGGCNACHLNYTQEAQDNLYQYKIGQINLPTIHPTTDVNMTNTHCYGCHSRSSRISTNYIGLHETLKEENDVIDDINYTVSQDGRVYSHQEEDIHHTKGLLCIDCHSSQEVMGDGKEYIHEEDAVKIQCSDCHFKYQPNTTSFDSMDSESKLVFMVRNYLHDDKPILITEKDKIAIVNTFLTENNKAFLIGKKDNVVHLLSPQSDICSKDNVHKDLTCSACHTSWAPRCIACHTSYDPKGNGFDLLHKKDVSGQWVEYVDGFHSGPPTLGVKYKNEQRKILPAVPGMIMTLDQQNLGNDITKKESFHRLYAPNAPHTTQKKARSCTSCHNSSVTLGYGEGTLDYDTHKLSQYNDITKTGFWKFIPSYELISYDNLPQDAWIGFLDVFDPDKIYSTRTDFRPFNHSEQITILTVGACLTCHKDQSNIMKESLKIGIDSLIQKCSKDCVLPSYK